MTAPFIGQITPYAFAFPPRGWALCNGQLLAINQNTALFSLLGTQYGGNGVTTFGLPDLRGRAGVNQGAGPGLSSYTIGQLSGVETVTLLSTQMPAHTHTWSASTAFGDQPAPTGGFLSGGQIPNGTPIPSYAAPGGATVPLSSAMLASIGGNSAHPNMQPYLVVSFCIAVQGIFPSRN